MDAELAKAMLSIGAVKGIEFGAGFSAASMLGSEHNDEMSTAGFLINHSGGIIGGISTGQEIPGCCKAYFFYFCPAEDYQHQWGRDTY